MKSSSSTTTNKLMFLLLLFFVKLPQFSLITFHAACQTNNNKNKYIEEKFV